MKLCSSAQQEGLGSVIKAGALGSPSARAGAVDTLDMDGVFFTGLFKLLHNLCILYACAHPQKNPATLH